jgi:hypothetical protein
MQLPLLALALLTASSASVRSQSLDVRLDPANHRATVSARYKVDGTGALRFRLNEQADVGAVLSDAGERTFRREDDELSVDLSGRDHTLFVRFEAVYQEDVEQGEQPGRIHNFSVNAHIGEEGVFLAEDSAWHPQWIDEAGHPHLVTSTLSIRELHGWAFVASGNPGPRPGTAKLTDPIWSWKTPRPVEGVAIAGNRHRIRGRVHETPHGPVEVVMHVPDEHADLAPMFIDAASAYLDLYAPLLGPFPYERFSIVENFFSSGFAFPGFTLFGPRVVAMAPHSLAPGYLDHELLHNWWGNGVYVDREDGNWCEALTSYSANYYRRIADHGEDAGREYRRAILMSLSSDPERLDDGPLGEWESSEDSKLSRFVGYEKGAFIFMMLEGAPGAPGGARDRTRLWLALKRFASEYMGKRANWNDLRTTIEAQFGESLEAFFQKWVREHDVPATPADPGTATLQEFYRRYSVERLFEVASGADEIGPWKEIDPNFLMYRALPPNQIIPTMAGTFGRGGVRVETLSVRDEVKRYLERLDEEDEGDGENLLLIGHAAIHAKAPLIAKCPNPIVVGEDSFELDGRVYDGPSQAVLHSMPHPELPGRFITVFHSNGERGWRRLPLIRFYGRDSSVVWEGDEVVAREVFEPSRRIHPQRGSAPGARARSSASMASPFPSTGRRTNSARLTSRPSAASCVASASGSQSTPGSCGPPVPWVRLGRAWPIMRSSPPGASAARARSSTRRSPALGICR